MQTIFLSNWLKRIHGRPVPSPKWWCAGFVCLACLAGNALADQSQIVVKPEVTSELLKNPGMGWETFHCASKADKNLPDWIPSAVYYCRWSWGAVEPQRGMLNTNLLEAALKEARESGQKLAFRVMCCTPDQHHSYTPAWLKTAGREILIDYANSGPVFPVPDFDDPVTLNLQLDLIKRLGERYDGHPDLDHVDLGSLGWWGEWHISHSKLGKMPAPENCRKVIDAYLQAFRTTPVLMILGAEAYTSYGTQRGAGLRGDSFGDLGTFSPTWNAMKELPHQIAKPYVQDAWKTAPIAYEIPGETMDDFVEKKWPLRWIFNYGLALHGSYFNGKSAKLPADKSFQDELARFLQRFGYHIVLNEIAHPAQAKAGSEFNISTKWQNVGCAPCYQPYRVAYRLGNASGYQKVFVSPTTVNHWLPGSIELFTPEFLKMPKDLPPGPVNEVTDSINLPANLPPGDYTLSIGVVDANSEQPVVRLGITGRDQDGWYPLSKVAIEPPANASGHAAISALNKSITASAP